jgi:hypothetical protein
MMDYPENLLETSGNRPRRFPVGFQIFYLHIFFSKFKIRKPAGNLPETGRQRFPEVYNPSTR